MGKDWSAMDFVKAVASHEDGEVKEALKASVSKKELSGEKQIAEQAASHHPHRFALRPRLGTAAARRRHYIREQQEAQLQQEPRQVPATTSDDDNEAEA
eukprot:CAMPEP_0118939716 /NCGR_PEP_ID=MMETSP1169-20130426/29635_1 /TAXON_ID=36882 /ORGANISM="Pyramimonas obovata, Strain CCMP722" /LENGTH=98 /DNA_ID=CAMNT_0006884047 /DNA_START=432 /DNA_END=728 /DNA_ORIENTATION=+